MAYNANNNLYDTELGLNVGMTSLRDVTMAERYTNWGDSLADGILTTWTQTAANGGTVTSTVGEGQLKTSTATAGAILMVSPTTVYLPGQVAWFNSAVRFGDTGVAGNIRRIGMFTVSGTTPQDGFYYELNGTTLNAVYVKAGSATAVAVGSWSEFAINPFTFDANYHGFEIRFTANSIWFYVDNKLRHKVSGTSTPLTTTLTLPIAIQNIKTSGATDITLGVRNVGTGAFGKPGSVATTIGTVGISVTTKATYRASTTAVLVAAVTSPNPWFTIYGSATKTVKIQSITISGLTLTAVAYLNIGVRKYSTAVSGGTSTALTKVPVDSASAASSATNINAYTAIPTAGTTVGDIDSIRVLGQATTAAAAGTTEVITLYFNPGGDGQFVTLRGTAEGIGLYWITAPASTPSMLVRIEWTEE